MKFVTWGMYRTCYRRHDHEDNIHKKRSFGIGIIYIFKNYLCLLSNLVFMLLIIALFAAIFFIPAFAEGNNDTSSQNEFATYENSTQGIKIDYPK